MKIPANKLQSSLEIGILFAYSAIILIGFFVPLQSDEIAWGYVNHRGIIDHYKMMILYPQCQEASVFAKDIPLLWYPYSWLNHLIFGIVEHPFWIKAIGVLRFVFFLALCWLIAKPLSKTLQISARTLFIIVLALLSMDELPLLLQVARPEQTLLLATSIFLVLALNADYISKSRLLKVCAALLFLITILIASPAHAKSIALIPIMAVCAWFLFIAITKSKILSLAAVAIFSGISIFSLTIWLDRHACPASEFGRMVLQSHSLPLHLIFSQPIEFIRSVITAWLFGITQDFHTHYWIIERKDWLPTTLAYVPNILLNMTDYYMMLLNALRIISYIICLVLLYKTIKRAVRNYKSSNYLNIVGSALFLTLTCLIVVSGHEHMWYMPALQLPLLILCVIILLAANSSEKFSANLKSKISITIMLLALLNLTFLAYRYQPYIYKPELRIKKLEQGTPIFLESPFGFEKKKSLINEIYSQCKLPTLEKANHLILDTTTYPVLKNSYQPFDFFYVSDWALYKNEKFLRLLENYNSDGMFINCNLAPPELQPYISQHGEYCCATLEQLKKIREK